MIEQNEKLTNIIISIIFSILLGLSEIIPIISNMKHTGIVHFLVNTGTDFMNKLKTQTPELQPLLQEITETLNSETIVNIPSNSPSADSPLHPKPKKNIKEINTLNAPISIPLTKTSDDFIAKREIQEKENLGKCLEELRTTISHSNSELAASVKDASETLRQVRLQSSEIYELNYITSFIKTNYYKKSITVPFLKTSNKELLISHGYIVDYDSTKENYTIKW